MENKNASSGSKKTTLRILLISIILGLATAFMANAYINSQIQTISGGEMVSIIVASKNIKRGDLITEDTFAIKELPSFFLHYKAITPDKKHLILGGTSEHDIPAGKPILYNDLEPENRFTLSQRLTPGNRAMSIRLAYTDAISGFIYPGDRVDIAVTQTSKGKQSSKLLLQNVTVIAVDGDMSADGKHDGKKSKKNSSVDITFNLKPDDANLLSLAEASGSIRLLLRNTHDIIIKNDTEVTLDELHKSHGGGQSLPSGVPKIYEGLNAIQDAYIPKNIEQLQRINAQIQKP